MEIKNSNLEDLPEIFRLYNVATDYQKKHFPGNVWPEFDSDLITQEIKENRQQIQNLEDKIS
ncbi:hypothetical protein [Halpernia frigidisoli]|uniref:hypothetical protein n=1 Tax=Halpernia frigidisoli TaxID=1125876 RepID=UPI001F3DA15C|nr:hypothetical protein [Halpernia frigidisoli]